jgi:hypothetical protein
MGANQSLPSGNLLHKEEEQGLGHFPYPGLESSVSCKKRTLKYKITFFIILYLTVKVKQSRYRPGVAQRVLGS